MNFKKIFTFIPNMIRNAFEKISVVSWHYYIEFVAKTARVKIEGIEEVQKNRMIGFWHEDSYSIQLVLKELQKRGVVTNVIVTKERRGDYIADMISLYGAKPMRLPDGMEMRSFMRDLKKESKEEGMILAAALDGPSGPYHRPKRLLFMLAHEANKGFAYARFKKRGMLALPWRWDKYRLPLPFFKLECHIDYFGAVDQDVLRDFDQYVEEHFTDVTLNLKK